MSRWRQRQKRSPRQSILIAFLLVVAFAIDASTPRGVADAIPYVIPILLTPWLANRRWIYPVAIICTLLTVLGFFLSFPGAKLSIALGNRFLALLVIWVIAALSLRWKYSQDEFYRLASAVEQAAEGIVITDPNGRIEYVNPAFTAISGYAEEEVMGENPRILKSGLHDRSFYEHLWETIVKGQIWSGEVINRRKNGELYTEWMTIAPVQDEQGKTAHFVAVMDDITERKRRERLQAALYRIAEAPEEERTLDDLYRRIHATIQDVMPAKNFYIALYDEREDLLSYPYSAGEVDEPLLPQKPGKGLTAYVLRTRKSLLCTQAVHDELERHGVVELVGVPPPIWLGVPLLIEERIVGAMIVWHYSDPSAYGESEQHLLEYVSTHVAKAIERKRAQEALQRSEQRYRELVENANDIIYTHDLEGNYTSINAAGERFMGYSAAEVKRLRVSDVVVPEDRERAREMIANLAQEQGTTHELEIKAKDGRRIRLELNTRLLYEDGKPVGVQGIGRDITERGILEQQLRQAQKMEAVGQLAGGVAHDFNNLLSVIIGYSDLMLDSIGTGDPNRRRAEEIRKAGERAAGLTRQLLAFSRKQVLKPRVLNLNEVVTSSEGMLRRLIGEDIDLATKLHPGLGHASADPGQIEQIILNLAANARDAMPNGGRLTLETANAEADETFAGRHRGARAGSYVMLAVSDTGHGMDEETRSHLFEPFFTTKEKGKGTGLGLATVYGIVKQSGGYVSVYSEPDHGTAFKVYFPRVFGAAEAAVISAVHPEASVPRGSLETVLVAEDERPLRLLVCEFLTTAGYRVLEAADCEEAIRLAQQHKESISLLVTDVVMPQMSGATLAQQVKELQPRTKVLYVSGYPDETVVKSGILRPEVNFLQKPFGRQALLRKVREVVAQE